jgi:NDP-sugar pyrophosphorylase family protein
MATICDVPLFDAALASCLRAGFQNIAINTHHLSDLMTDHALACAKEAGLKDIYISKETPEILGTGGALHQLSDWWGQDDLLVYNGDILSEISLGQLWLAHQASSNLVTLVYRATPPADGGRSLWLDPAQRVVAIAKKADLPTDLPKEGLREAGFACAYVVRPHFRKFLPKQGGFFDLIDGFNQAIAAGEIISGIPFSGYWADIGNPRALWEANLVVASMPTASRQVLLGRVTDGNMSKPSNFSVDSRSFIASSVTPGPGCVIENSVLLRGAVVDPGERLSGVLRGLGLNETFS